MDLPSGRRRGTGPAKIAIVDDHALVRDGLVFAVRNRGRHEVVTACGDVQTLLDWCQKTPPTVHPDLVLLDLMLNGALVDPAEVKELINRDIQVLIVSGTPEGSLIRSLLNMGVIGYVAKEDSQEQLLTGIEAALSGQPWTSPQLAEIVARDPDRPDLSDRELEAVQLYGGGLKMESVARHMGVSYHTARQYVDRARQKYAQAGRDVRTKTEIYQAAIEDRLISPSPTTKRSFKGKQF